MSGGAAEADVTVSLPKLTDEDFASAFRKARMSSWNVRKDLAIDDGVAEILRKDSQQRQQKPRIMAWIFVAKKS